MLLEDLNLLNSPVVGVPCAQDPIKASNHLSFVFVCATYLRHELLLMLVKTRRAGGLPPPQMGP